MPVPMTTTSKSSAAAGCGSRAACAADAVSSPPKPAPAPIPASRLRLDIPFCGMAVAFPVFSLDVELEPPVAGDAAHFRRPVNVVAIAADWDLAGAEMRGAMRVRRELRAVEHRAVACHAGRIGRRDCRRRFLMAGRAGDTRLLVHVVKCLCSCERAEADRDY